MKLTGQDVYNMLYDTKTQQKKKDREDKESPRCSRCGTKLVTAKTSSGNLLVCPRCKSLKAPDED